jgi:hypothetical protein
MHLSTSTDVASPIDACRESVVIRNKGLFFTAAAVLTASLMSPAEARAQHGRGGVHAAVVVGAPFYYAPYWYSPWGYGYPFGYPYPVGYVYDNSASLRLQVEPKQTEVYIDGYYAGTVDEFDGFFQRLHAQPGQHDLELYLDGYRTVRQQIYLQPGTTFKVKYAMQPLQPGDTPDERPTPRPAPPASAGSAPLPPPPAPRAGQRPLPPPPRGDAGAVASSSFGAVVIQVQPPDAEIMIDGEPWQSAGGARLVVQLAPGDHRVEVRKGGFQTFQSTVRVRAGETTPLNVSLAQE